MLVRLGHLSSSARSNSSTWIKIIKKIDPLPLKESSKHVIIIFVLIRKGKNFFFKNAVYFRTCLAEGITAFIREFQGSTLLRLTHKHTWNKLGHQAINGQKI